jgi:hypothetical protein
MESAPGRPQQHVAQLCLVEAMADKGLMLARPLPPQFWHGVAGLSGDLSHVGAALPRPV